MNNSFFETLKDNLIKKNLNETSINLYLRNLKKLNNNQEIKNFRFLIKPADIMEKIKDLKDNTKRQYLISIVSSLKVSGDKFKNLYKKYYKLMLNLHNSIKEKPTEEKTETQNKNWLNWDEITKIYNDMKTNLYDNIKIKNKKWNEKIYNEFLNFLILSLYVLIQPRRNMDYMKMLITVNNDINDKNYNYLDVKNKEFIFNKYKTAKHETKDGSLVIKIPDDLMEILNIYIKNHPLKNKEKNNIPLLVNFNGEPLNSVNSITRILNKIFNKKIGVSMLRHSFLSSKYKNVLEEQEKDAKAMSHNIQTQKDYIKI